MKLTRTLAVLALAAWAGSLAQADARQRGGKHAAQSVRHSGVHHPVAGRGNASQPTREINPDAAFVPPSRRNPKQDIARSGLAKKAAAHSPGSSTGHRRHLRDAKPTFTGKNAIGVATQPPSTSPASNGRKTDTGTNAYVVVAKPNAIGVPAGTGVPPHVAPAGLGKFGAGANPTGSVHPAHPGVWSNGGTVSGTGMARPGFAPGTLGGPAKLAGGINGTGLKPKR